MHLDGTATDCKSDLVVMQDYNAFSQPVDRNNAAWT